MQRKLSPRAASGTSDIEALLDRFAQEVPDPPDALGFRHVRRFEVDVPVRLTAKLAVACDEAMARRQLVNAVKHCGRRRDELIPDVPIERLHVHFRRDRAGRQDRLDLGREHALAVPCIVEWLDAESVACEHESTFVVVPKPECELTVNMINAIDPVFLPLVDNDFGIATRTKHVPAAG